MTVGVGPPVWGMFFFPPFYSFEECPRHASHSLFSSVVSLPLVFPFRKNLDFATMPLNHRAPTKPSLRSRKYLILGVFDSDIGQSLNTPQTFQNSQDNRRRRDD